MESVLSGIKDYKADSKAVVVFTLNEGNADFPYLVSDYKLPIMPANPDGTADWQSGIRTGAYMLESFEPGVSSKFKRFANYHWSPRPYFDSCEILVINDAAARSNALTSGAVDYVEPCELKTLSLLRRNPQIAINEVTGYGHYTLPMLVDVKPFDDINVRMALKHAIDREEIVRKVFYGHAKTGNDDPIAPSIKYAVNPEPIHHYDVDKAKYYLKQSGLSSLKVDLHFSDMAFPGSVDVAALIKDTAAKCGIDVNLVREPEDGYWSNVWLKKGWCACSWSGRATCDWMFSTGYAKGAAWNDTHWANPRFNKLLVEARAETNEKKRADMYAEMQQLVHDDGGTVVLAFSNYVSANTTKLAHGTIAGNWAGDGLRLAERWWFA